MSDEGVRGGDLAGVTALVVGASRGIGLATARELRARGAWVAMVARGRDELARVAEDVGGHPVAADVSSPSGVHALASYVTELLGDAPDVVVASSGAFLIAPVAETSPEDFDRVVAANLRGPFLLARAFLPAMLARGHGHLVQLGSVAGRVAYPGNGAYSASKFGLRGLHEVLLAELRGTGVRATLVEPAATDTPLWDPLDPDGRDDLPSRAAMLRPEDVARAVVFAVSQPRGVQIPVLAVEASG